MLTAEGMLDIARVSLETLLWVSGPVMMVALLVGLLIGLFQALTSIQEMTLTFVPKIIIVFAALLMLLPFMGDKLNTFAREIFSMIAGGSGLA